MAGGINAWEGLVSEGAPEAGMAFFSPATRPEELIALAWYLEEGSRKFYSQLAQTVGDGEAKRLYRELAEAEEGHQAALLKLYQELSGTKADPGFPGSVVSPGKEGDVMEGGVRVAAALEWVTGKKMSQVLELSLSLETNSYDLYVKMGREMKDQRSGQVFRLLSGEEKEHLERISSLFESFIDLSR